MEQYINRTYKHALWIDSMKFTNEQDYLIGKKLYRVQYRIYSKVVYKYYCEVGVHGLTYLIKEIIENKK